MRITNFIELMLSFILLVLSIGFFHFIKIDINFITTLLLTVFTIGISIFFYSESNMAYRKIRDLIGGLNIKMAHIEEQTKGINIYKTKTLLNQEQIKRRFINERKRKIRF